MSSRIIRRRDSEGLVPHPPPVSATPSRETAPEQRDRRLAELERTLPLQIEQARQAGFRDGEAAGAARAQAALDSAIQQLARSVAELAGYRARYRRDSEQEMLKLSLAVARKVLHREVTMDPHALLGVIKAALETLNAAEIYRLRLAPPDAAALEREISRLGLPQQVEVTPDPKLSRGAIHFETARGLIDAGVQTQLAEIERGFTDRLGTD